MVIVTCGTGTISGGNADADVGGSVRAVCCLILALVVWVLMVMLFFLICFPVAVTKRNRGRKGSFYPILPGHGSSLREVRAGTPGNRNHQGILLGPRYLSYTAQAH